MKRGLGKIRNSLSLKDAYKEFDKKQTPDSAFYIDYKTYRRICENFNKRAIEEILYHAREFKVPGDLGRIRIKKAAMSFADKKTLKVDWKKTNELGTVIYHMNDHRDNYKYRWYWEKAKVKNKHKRPYSFTATRGNKRTLARILLTDNTVDYFE